VENLLCSVKRPEDECLLGRDLSRHTFTLARVQYIRTSLASASGNRRRRVREQMLLQGGLLSDELLGSGAPAAHP
jgi:hypothetical protein